MHAVSGALSLPSRGAFHLSLAVLCTIGHLLVFSLGGWSPRLRTGFHVSRPTPRWAPLAWIATGLSPAVGGLSIPLRSPSKVRWSSGLLPVRSPLLRESRLISFPPGTEMFQFPGLASAGLCIRPEDTQMRGFPHSESPRSKTLCVSRGTFGAWPVLRRRLMPRHPPRAFLRLNPVFQRFSSIYCCMSSSNPPLFLGASSHSVLVAFSYVVAKFFNLRSVARTDSSLRPGAPYWS